jgi:hypothetical protein
MIDKDMEFVTNTKSMNMQPQSPDDFNLMDGFENKPMKLLPVMTGEQFQKNSLLSNHCRSMGQEKRWS